MSDVKRPRKSNTSYLRGIRRLAKRVCDEPVALPVLQLELVTLRLAVVVNSKWRDRHVDISQLHVDHGPVPVDADGPESRMTGTDCPQRDEVMPVTLIL